MRDLEENTPPETRLFSVFRAVSLAALTALAMYLCWRMTAPFLNAFTWAFALTVASAPLRGYFFARMPRVPATLLIMTIVILVVAVPVALVSRQLFQESLRAQQFLQRSIGNGDWRAALAGHHWIAALWTWADQQLDLSQIGQQLAAAMARLVAPAVARSVGVISQAGVALLAFFFFLRDQDHALAGIRRLLPLSAPEIDYLFSRVSSAVRATIYGRVFVGIVQGFLGGVMFAFIGLPAPIFWGAVMAFLSILPVLGAFVVWVPAALFLLAQGHWIRVVILSIWCVVVVHQADNVLYPALVGARLGLHALVLFIAFVGGLMVFGPTGLILGPCIVAVGMGLAEIWQARSTGTPLESRYLSAHR
ncbi:MAG TPA: AI-2E family transporter [Bryobacteraceae bacterium]|nr:AI-2E family transporter [Bryobacteraceae bacterium]